jgi:hypothetical protein
VTKLKADVVLRCFRIVAAVTLLACGRCAPSIHDTHVPRRTTPLSRDNARVSFEVARPPFLIFYFGFEEIAEKFRRGVYDGEWVSREWLSFMAACVGLRWLFVVNVDHKVIFASRITYDGKDDEEIMLIKEQVFSFDEWSGKVSISTHLGKSRFKRLYEEARHAEKDDLAKTFAVLMSSGTTGKSLHYVAVRPSDDNSVPFLQTLDSNSRGRLFFEKFQTAQSATTTQLGQEIGKYVSDVRKKKQEAPGLRWCDLAASGADEMVMDDEGGPPAAATRSASKNRAGGSKDDHSEDRSVSSDDFDASLTLAARMARGQKKGVHGEGSSAGRDDEDADAGKSKSHGKRAVRGEGSSAGRDKVRGKGSSAGRDKADDDDDEDADAGKSKSHGKRAVRGEGSSGQFFA